MAPAADATVRGPIVEHATERIPAGPHLQLAGMVRIVARVRDALAHDAARIEIDLQHTQTITEGASLLLETVARSVARHGTELVLLHRVAQAA